MVRTKNGAFLIRRPVREYMICAPAQERSHSPAGGGRGRGPRHGGYAAFLQNAGLFFRVDSQGLHPGLVCDAPSGHGVRNRVRAWDWERIDVEAERYRARHKTFGEAFGAATVAGYAGPGFHNWPSGHIAQDNGSETAFSHPVPCQKDVRIGVRRRDRGQRSTATEEPNTKRLRR